MGRIEGILTTLSDQRGDDTVREWSVAADVRLASLLMPTLIEVSESSRILDTEESRKWSMPQRGCESDLRHTTPFRARR
jgi:hypothetical protein